MLYIINSRIKRKPRTPGIPLEHILNHQGLLKTKNDPPSDFGITDDG